MLGLALGEIEGLADSDALWLIEAEAEADGLADGEIDGLMDGEALSDAD